MTNRLRKIEVIEFPTFYGDLLLTAYDVSYENQLTMKYVLVITNKTITENPIVRIHSECMLSEVFKSVHCDCREQLELSLQLVRNNDGILFYLNQEGRGHGLMQKIKELKKQEEGLDTVEASEYYHLNVDDRKYDVVADILKEMEIDSVQLMTNSPIKVKELEGLGVKISKRIPVEVVPNTYNRKYLNTKKEKLGHFLNRYV